MVALLSRSVKPPRDRARSNGCADRLRLQVVIERVVSHLASPARLLVAAERHRRIEDVVAVDPDRTRAQAVGDAVSLADVPRIDTRREPVCRIVRALNKSSSASLNGVAVTTGPKISSRRPSCHSRYPLAPWARRNNRTATCRRRTSPSRPLRRPRADNPRHARAVSAKRAAPSACGYRVPDRPGSSWRTP